LEVSMVRDLENIDGVVRASANAGMLLDPEGSAVSMGMPPMITASDFREVGYEKFKVTYAEGRDLRKGETDAVVIGSDLVSKLDAQLGGTVEIREEDYTVVGILEKTLTAPDNAVTMSMKDAQAIMLDDLPDAVAVGTNPDTLANSIAVYIDQGLDPDRMAKRIQAKIGDEYEATGPQGFKTAVTEPLKIFNQIIYAIGAVALLVGGLSVINTMTMSVAERTREIGIRKAIGATSLAIMRQFIAESAIIGLIGGLIGLLLGWLIVAAGNAAGAASANTLFLLTPRLAFGSVAFAVGLGVVSGLYPAWHAAQLNPVQALRYE
ncbi:MAG: ABC transporter permease, partial [Coriobacteriales bacterium]|nr:ABC transporter permease [Coriobacteriales bacterium]